MARAPNRSQTKKVHVTIPVSNYDRLEWLAETGLFGPTAAEVAKYFITAGLADLSGKAVLPIKLPMEWLQAQKTKEA
jgi:hypothetical protein